MLLFPVRNSTRAQISPTPPPPLRSLSIPHRFHQPQNLPCSPANRNGFCLLSELCTTFRRRDASPNTVGLGSPMLGLAPPHVENTLFPRNHGPPSHNAPRPRAQWPTPRQELPFTLMCCPLSVAKLQVWRIFLSPFSTPSFLGVLIGAWVFAQIGAQFEVSGGNGFAAWITPLKKRHKSQPIAPASH